MISGVPHEQNFKASFVNVLFLANFVNVNINASVSYVLLKQNFPHNVFV